MLVWEITRNNYETMSGPCIYASGFKTSREAKKVLKSTNFQARKDLILYGKGLAWEKFVDGMRAFAIIDRATTWDITIIFYDSNGTRIENISDQLIRRFKL